MLFFTIALVAFLYVVIMSLGGHAHDLVTGDAGHDGEAGDSDHITSIFSTQVTGTAGGQIQGCKVVSGGGVLVWPIVQEIAFMDTAVFKMEIQENDIPNKDNVKISVKGVANIDNITITDIGGTGRGLTQVGNLVPKIVSDFVVGLKAQGVDVEKMLAKVGMNPWSFPEAPLCLLPPRRFEEHEDSRNRTLKITETAGFIELRALRVLRGENSRQLQEKTMGMNPAALVKLLEITPPATTPAAESPAPDSPGRPSNE